MVTEKFQKNSVEFFNKLSLIVLTVKFIHNLQRDNAN